MSSASSSSSSESLSSPFGDGGSLVGVLSRVSSGLGCCGVVVGWRSASVEGEDVGAGL